MMRRVVICKSEMGQQGGLEKYAFRLLSAFLNRGCAVTLLTSGPLKDFVSHPQLKVVTTPLPRYLSVRKLLHFDHFCKEYMQKEGGDIVFGLDRVSDQTHLRAGNGVHAAYLKERAKRDPFFKRLSYPLNPLHRSLLNIEKRSFEHPALKTLFTNSEMVKREILEHYSVSTQKIEVVHNGVEWEEMDVDFRVWKEKKNLFAKEEGLDPEAFHFLFVGHNFQRKGLSPLLEGLAHLKEKNVHLSVIGKEKNLSPFIEQIKKFRLEKQVRFFGPRTDIRTFYQLADALVIPSFYDPFANVTVEALAMGVFVVSSKTNGGCEIVTPQNGVLIDALESSSVADTLKKALEHFKTEERAKKIRASVKHLDFSSQLTKIVEKCL